MMTIEEYVKLHRGCRREVADVMLRRLPEVVALWRSEQVEPQGRLQSSVITIDEVSGFVSINSGDDKSVTDADDVKDYGALIAELSVLLPKPDRRISMFADACRRGDYSSIGDVMLAVERRKSGNIYWYLLGVIVLLLVLLVILNRYT